MNPLTFILGMIIILVAMSNGLDPSDLLLGPLGTSLAIGFPVNLTGKKGKESLLGVD